MKAFQQNYMAKLEGEVWGEEIWVPLACSIAGSRHFSRYIIFLSSGHDPPLSKAALHKVINQ